MVNLWTNKILLRDKGKYFTFMINPTPSNAKVIINGIETRMLSLTKNGQITWSVSADGYKPPKWFFNFNY